MGVLLFDRLRSLARCASPPVSEKDYVPYNAAARLAADAEVLVVSSPPSLEPSEGPPATSSSRALWLTPAAPVLDGKYVGIFFGAAWCPSCKTFMSALIRFYNFLQPTGMFEVIYVPLDRNIQEYRGFVQAMPWYALPFKHPGELLRRYKVRSLPSLVLVTPDDAVLTGDAVELIKESGSTEKFAQIFQRFSGPVSLGNRFRTLFG
ncbi:putative thioredoxin family redox-active protein [Besnoitia besnoiti]|uniref:Putative thioredoxin family redox-active protein n=1 Tax=Besnoitia besnoiti TaxID=94643 RepID=A0A2A9M890_BESBE|nr:putative thioredoxin family redox-active protein [Besnoitia besnoiti]PFH32136.1 putative thioredoxin family redox-active protein [Besnoitia besnoiti]